MGQKRPKAHLVKKMMKACIEKLQIRLKSAFHSTCPLHGPHAKDMHHSSTRSNEATLQNKSSLPF
jgi:hypothetical protein